MFSIASFRPVVRLFTACLVLVAAPAFSAEPAAATTPHPPTVPAKAPDGQDQFQGRLQDRTLTTQVVTDEKAHTVRVLIDGKEILTINAEGLHVHGDIDYAGVLTDTGMHGP